MPLKPGFTSFHSAVMCSLEADMWRRTERRIRRYIDRGHENAVSYLLHECADSAGEKDELVRLVAYMRKDALTRWMAKWGERPRMFG